MAKKITKFSNSLPKEFKDEAIADISKYKAIKNLKDINEGKYI